MNNQLPLFVFGTLRSGQCNHRLIAGRYAERSPAILYDYSWCGPLMICRRANSAVEGELFVLDPEEYAAVMADCDELEGLACGETRGAWYERKALTVVTPRGEKQAWVYVQPE